MIVLEIPFIVLVTCDVGCVFLQDSEGHEIVDEDVQTFECRVLLALPVTDQFQENSDAGTEFIELFDMRAVRNQNEIVTLAIMKGLKTRTWSVSWPR